MSDLLARQAMDEVFAPFARRAGLLIAVSGGPDSMALLRLVAIWASVEGSPPISAVTVDHGLRDGSRDEAAQVGEWCGALGVRHAILTWNGPKPSTRIQELARAARYALMEAHAVSIGADTLLTGHHADDQAETILFRLTRGSGVAGLAGMAPERMRGGVYLARPLLDVGKKSLIDVCERLGQVYVTDPSNKNPRFARTGLRALAQTLAAQGLGPDELLRLGRRAARAEEALAAMAAELTASLKPLRSSGEFKAAAGALAFAPMELIVRILMLEIARVSGTPPRMERTETLADRLKAALHASQPLRSTLGGALVALGKDGRLSICRELARRSSVKGGESEPDLAIGVHTVVKKTPPVRSLLAVSLGKGQREA